MRIEVEKDEDVRWLAKIKELPGVMTYGQNREDALSKVEVLALRVIADRVEHCESIPD
ncbi:MAG: type II toxin-antitoxin system HicB family antitoxin [Candidatus Kuenenia sp.]|nr:type II toxin-antitoxin system HicB family antitoxin [Candidatus Kuenenia hertensis]